MAEPLSGVQVLELELLGEVVADLLADGRPLVEAIAPVARWVRDERVTLGAVLATGFQHIAPSASPALVISAAAFQTGERPDPLYRELRAYLAVTCPAR